MRKESMGMGKGSIGKGVQVGMGSMGMGMNGSQVIKLILLYCTGPVQL